MEKFNVLIDQNTLDKRISEIAEQISKDYINEEIILVCILKGAVYFATDLSKKITNNTVFLDFMKIKIDSILKEFYSHFEKEGFKAYQEQRFHSISASLFEAKYSRTLATVAAIVAIVSVIIAIFC